MNNHPLWRNTAALLIYFLIFQYTLFCQATERTGGKYLPSEGNVHALLIFAQFPDDRYEPAESNWKLNQPPDYMSTFIDPSTDKISHNGNLSCYFDDMSLHKFQLTGKSIFVTTPHKREWYLDNKKSRTYINEEIVQKADSILDFSEFDNWTRKGDYTFVEESDGVVDMVFVIFRNIAYELDDNARAKIEVQFGLVPGGEASLGHGSSIRVDNGQRIVETKYPGSGLNVKANLKQIPVSGCAHEFGHYLIGGHEAHFASGIYGLMSTWGFTQRSIMMNGWERLKLDWVNAMEFGPGKGSYKDIILRDYLSTGDLIKINVPDSKEYYLLENHQMINKYWDLPDQSGKDVEGVYVLQQSGNAGNTVTMICADGKWQWEVTEKVANPYGGKDSLPVFTKIKADPVKGNFDNEMIPFKINNRYGRDFIHFFKDPVSGKIIEQAVFRGDGNDSFNLERDEFSQYTNPTPLLSNKKPAGISFKIKSSRRENDGSESYRIDINIK